MDAGGGCARLGGGFWFGEGFLFGAEECAGEIQGGEGGLGGGGFRGGFWGGDFEWVAHGGVGGLPGGVGGVSIKRFAIILESQGSGFKVHDSGCEF